MPAPGSGRRGAWLAPAMRQQALLEHHIEGTVALFEVVAAVLENLPHFGLNPGDAALGVVPGPN